MERFWEGDVGMRRRQGGWNLGTKYLLSLSPYLLFIPQSPF
jgi:hypothetical protein